MVAVIAVPASSMAAATVVLNCLEFLRGVYLDDVIQVRDDGTSTGADTCGLLLSDDDAPLLLRCSVWCAPVLGLTTWGL